MVNAVGDAYFFTCGRWLIFELLLSFEVKASEMSAFYSVVSSILFFFKATTIFVNIKNTFNEMTLEVYFLAK